MTVKRALLAFTTLLALLGSPVADAAEPAQATGNAWQFCDQATEAVETTKAIPARLLKAISLAETGRWDRENKENFAWPWTITALGKGHYFPDPQSALDFVRRLQARGIQNIDVGCMQVNLYYHGGAFASLEDAIEPVSNVSYAAKYLKGLYRSTRSWTQAAAHYHSTTPTLARRYKLKVLKYWNSERRLASMVDPDVIDYGRMRDLNARFIKRDATAATAPGQLQAWNAPRSGGHTMATLAAMRRAAQEGERRKQYLGDKSERTPEILAHKRRNQLNKWRLTRLPSGKLSGG
ncbi:MAG: transglycosylase SLT domain-containing protein [Rhodospirillaceae bacterium]|jgi:hypothetical protein|nr:transglycosylase SLT domain-containing protein [Alphaproteobacteria bacterium]MBT4463205.1 transglycosylase SLT domain-containing protein [Rhodospirillaceae bacterium]MBT6407002.1 transglycosylase SLT domain-containing protein [Rhodospirillaceae bacterium]MBT7357160.1 transglycosylase SLT domain-containing protein [Rhodospirillaceae bacterium]